MPPAADFRAFVLDQIDELDRLYDQADPHLVEESAAVFAAAAQAAGNMAARLGLAELHRRSLDFGAFAD